MRLRTEFRPRRQHDRYPRAEHHTRRIRLRQINEIFGQHVAGLEIGHDQDLRPPGDRRVNALDPCRLRARWRCRRRAAHRALPPVIWPRSAILHSAAASMVDGILDVTVSTAERMATRGVPSPTGVKRSTAFCTMSRLASRSGKILIAASVINSVSACDGTSMTKTWLIRRAVRKPVLEDVTARISSSVCRLPFINNSPCPALISSTALAAAASLCGASTTLKALISISCSRADALILAIGPTRVGMMSPIFAASNAPRSEVSSHGCTTIALAAATCFASRNQPVVFRRRRRGDGSGRGSVDATLVSAMVTCAFLSSADVRL